MSSSRRLAAGRAAAPIRDHNLLGGALTRIITSLLLRVTIWPHLRAFPRLRSSQYVEYGCVAPAAGHPQLQPPRAARYGVRESCGLATSRLPLRSSASSHAAFG